VKTHIAFVCLLAASSAFSFDPNHLFALRQSGQCYGCDLVGADFRGYDLNGWNLTGSNLSFADFRNARNISNAVLSGANLGGAIWYNGMRCREGSIGSCTP